MRSKLRDTLSAMMWAMLLLAAYTMAAHAQTSATNNQPAAKKGSAIHLTGISPAVTGTGTIGQITKWTSLNGIGDSVITEDKFGKVGIGTTAPTQKLTVQGMIETTLGGYKFPDGTVQTTAAASGLSVVAHDVSLTGNGTPASPLSLQVIAGSGLEGYGTISSPLKISVPLSFSSSDAVATMLLVNSGSGEGITVFTNSGTGVNGQSQNGTAINGHSYNGIGVEGSSSGVAGVLGTNTNGDGVVGEASDANTFAGNFMGNVQVKGDLNVMGLKNFKIDHPLDPENKYLFHAAIESSEVKNLYDGVVMLDANGEAVIKLADWCEALNKDFRYSLTALGSPAPGLYVASEVANNQFKIAGGIAGMKVSWQVTGVRNDAYTKKHPMQVEVAKPEAERGHYLQPELFNQPAEKSIDWARHPLLMQRLNEMKQKHQE